MPDAMPGAPLLDKPSRSARSSRRRALTNAVAALGVGSVVVTACDYDEYPGEASFCDDWCRTLRRTSCEQEPENCVRDCERALPSAACFPHQLTLLDCYRSTPSDQFVCVDQGFQGQIRPLPEICRPERDVLIACEAPNVLSCIEACRELDAADPVLATDPPGEAPCPISPLPCERLCWTLDAALSSEMPAVVSESPSNLTALGAPLIACAHDGARRCWQEAGEAPPASARVSWTRVLLECAEPFDVPLL